MAMCNYIRSREEGIAPYLKRLVKEDMEKNGVAFEPVPARNPHWAKQKEDDSEC